MVEHSPLNVGERLWKGPDVSSTNSVLLMPSQSAAVPILITSESFPPRDAFFSKNLAALEVSTRSRVAQLGVEVCGILKEGVPQNILRDWQSLNGNVHSFEAKIKVKNHCKRPIRIPENFPIFRFFHETIASSIIGKALKFMYEEEKLKIEGEEGKDWEWSMKRNNTTGEMEPIGLFIKIDSQGRKYISPSDTPIILDDKVHDYRKSIDSISEPIRETSDSILWVGETPKITLGEDLEIILGKSAFHDFREMRSDGMGRQINSRLIDGGRTDWKIRVEILSPTTLSGIPNYVYMHLTRNGS